MLIINKKSDLVDILSQYGEKNNLSVGFVPTMGFLHSGHGSLIEKSKSENDITVCDIFVNPLQFNDRSDFEKYPRNTEKDTAYLESIGCDILYLPDYEDVYPLGHQPLQYDFGNLEKVMEGAFRPGHFQGVAEVVRILFDIVKPTKAYFGEKDFQQLRIIQELVKQLNIPVQIVPCPIVREADGLAMSSRNARLQAEDRKKASFIFEQLSWCAMNYINFSPEQIKIHVKNAFLEQSEFSLEYVEIAALHDLMPVDKWENCKGAGVYIAAFLGGVRLIDNIVLFRNFAK